MEFITKITYYGESFCQSPTIIIRSFEFEEESSNLKGKKADNIFLIVLNFYSIDETKFK